MGTGVFSARVLLLHVVHYADHGEPVLRLGMILERDALADGIADRPRPPGDGLRNDGDTGRIRRYRALSNERPRKSRIPMAWK